MFDYREVIEGHLHSLKRENRYRIFREVARHRGSFPLATLSLQGEERRITIWCSNDYLGMGQHPTVIQAMKEALDKYGAGAGGTRNISGTHKAIVELESELADLHHKESALVFTSGYIANEATLSTLASKLPGCVILSDSHNHASMIEGIRHSGVEKRIFRHNDAAHLRELLRAMDPKKPKIVAFEALYSMDGDRANLEDIIAVSKEYGALTYVDETHSVALYGPRGGGILEEEGLLQEVDIIQGGLGKGFGVVGGFITGNSYFIDLIRSFGSGFIFTTSLPPVVAAGVTASIRHLKNSSAERTALFMRATEVKEKLSAANLPFLLTDTQVVPFMVGESKKCQEVADTLLYDYGLYLQPINYPTVPKGTERLRITPSPLHSSDDIDYLVNSLKEVWSNFLDDSAAEVGEAHREVRL